MKHCLLGFLLLLTTGYTYSQTYAPVAVTGFNHDIIAEGTGNSSLTTTTKEMDDIIISNHVICTKAFAGANAIPSTYGVPNDGGIVVNGTRSYQLSPFDAKNALYLLTTESGTLTLATPGMYSRISLLLTSTEGNSTINVVFNFDDGTTYLPANQIVYDWVNNYTNIAYTGYGRVNRKTGTFATGDYDFGGTNPRFYYRDYTMPCDKKLVSITIKNVSSTIVGYGSYRTFILGVSGISTEKTGTAVATGASLCVPGPASLAITSPVSGYTYSWYSVASGGSAIGTGTGYTTGTVSDDSTFYVNAVNSWGCPGERVPVQVSFLPPLTEPAVVNAQLCTPATATLEVAYPDAALTYNWYTSATGSVAAGTGTTFTTGTLTEDTTLYVVAVNSASCKSAAVPVNVSFVSPPSPPVVDAVSVCPGEATTLSVKDPQTNLTYEWFDAVTGGSSLGTGNSYSFTAAGTGNTYYVTASSNSSCISGSTAATAVLLTALANPVVSATDVGVDRVTFTWLPVTGATGYEVSVNNGTWQTPSSGGRGTTHTVTGLPYLSTVTIDVAALGVKVCQRSDAGEAFVKLPTNEIFIPNTFTPNGDGKNDVFAVYSYAIKEMNMKIFNQWGELLFSSANMGNTWDGTYKGKQQPVGVYIYAVKLVLTTGEVVIRKGDINLVR